MKKQFSFLFLILVCLCFCVNAFAHSGNTDSNGGHYDRSTGQYHYHHGYPAHLHPNGVCPYEESKSVPPNNLISVVVQNSRFYSLSNEDYSNANSLVSEWKSKNFTPSGSVSSVDISTPQHSSSDSFQKRVIEWILGTLVFGMIAHATVIMLVETVEAIVKKSFDKLTLSEIVSEYGYIPCCIVVGLYIFFFVL